MSTDDTGWYPQGFVNPADDPDIDWIVPATDDDPVPPAERLAEEPEHVESDPGINAHLAAELQDGGDLDFQETEARQFVQPGFAGLDLRNYSQNPQQKGWGAPCTAARATVRLTVAAVTVDARLAELTGLIMRECERRGYQFRQADTGAYNCRYIGGTTTWSNHAWAIAVDVNWQSNPYTTAYVTDIPEWMHHLWNRYGFAWGGDYTGGRRDFMHFEFMGSPQQAYTALVLARRELTPQPAPAPAPEPEPITEDDDDMKLVRNPKGTVVLLSPTWAEWIPTSADHRAAITQFGTHQTYSDDFFNRIVMRAREAGTPPNATTARTMAQVGPDGQELGEDPSEWPPTPDPDDE